MTADETMLDEYGNPIGQLTVNMGGGREVEALHVVDTTVAVAQDRALEDNAAELPGIAPQEIAEYYPGYDDDRKRDRAKRLVIIEGREVADVARAVKVPERTVLMWASNFRWADARRKEVAAKDEMSRLELAETRIRKRNEVFNEQLDQARRIRNKSMDAMERGEASVKSGAEAWAAASKTEQTILGLSEAGKVAAADGGEGGEGDDKKGGRQPLVMVIANGGLPPVRRAP
jgi:hypothetical protein